MAAALRDDKNIVGIQVYEEEQMLSLYADDTTLYLAGSERHLRASLNALQEFQLISGLKVIEKTKIIKIGVRGGSRDTFCEEQTNSYLYEKHLI